MPGAVKLVAMDAAGRTLGEHAIESVGEAAGAGAFVHRMRYWPQGQPCRCPSCGWWDDDGDELEIACDFGGTLHIVGDPERGQLQECRSCEEPVGELEAWMKNPPTAAEAPLSDPDAKTLGPFARQSETSRQAALKAYPRQGTQRWRIVNLLSTHYAPRPGLTRDQIAERLGMSPNTVRPRVRELIDGGWVEVSTDDLGVLTGKSAAGQDAELLRATVKALKQIDAAKVVQL